MEQTELKGKLDEMVKGLREILTRLQALEDKIDSMDERLADIDRIDLLRDYD